ncbi:hypothetical protein OROGR_000404 [Orobanche gracilis]
MASSQVEVEGREMHLKHLGFVRILTINAVALISNLYVYAKQNSGSLKSTIDTVENAVTTVVGPVYERLKGVPSDLLAFLDKKVDEATHKIDECAPPAAKNFILSVQIFFKKASQAAQGLSDDVKVAGPLAAVIHVSKISKHLAVNWLAVAWYKVNQHPALHGVTVTVVRTSAHWSQKYNKVITNLTANGYYLFDYAPLVPVDEMSKAYKQVEAAAAKKIDAASSRGSDSDKE